MGEFEKRIRNCGTENRTWKYDEKFVSVSFLRKLIEEEAKQEFPKIEEHETTDLSWEELSKIQEEKCLLRKKWFLKWFGD